MIRSPIELFWTAKKMCTKLHKKSDKVLHQINNLYTRTIKMCTKLHASDKVVHQSIGDCPAQPTVDLEKCFLKWLQQRI